MTPAGSVSLTWQRPLRMELGQPAVSWDKSNAAYAYPDAAKSLAYTINGLNQYAAVNSNAYTYDANGNLTSDGGQTLVYDAENRLVSASGAHNATLSYDPLGRLWQVYSPATGTTQFAYDGDAMIAEYDGSGNMLRRYVHSDAADDPLVWYEGSQITTPRYLYADRQGSIVAVTDAGGNPLVIDQYDEWGVPSAQTLSVTQRFGYTGQAWLPELGMYYYKARIYAPQLGRFLQTDPIGYADQVNLYAYVGNDPVDGRDPSGLCTGSLISNSDGSCKGHGDVNPGLNGAGTSTGVVPGKGPSAPSLVRPVRGPITQRQALRIERNLGFDRSGRGQLGATASMPGWKLISAWNASRSAH